MSGQNPGGHRADNHQQENRRDGGHHAVFQTDQELLVFRNNTEIVAEGGILGPCQVVDGNFVLELNGVDHTDVEGNQGDQNQRDAEQLFQS